MEEKKKKTHDVFDEAKVLVDWHIDDPFVLASEDSGIQTYPFDTTHSAGYIRYTITGKSLVIIDCVTLFNKNGLV
jgi:hypothetical protein